MDERTTPAVARLLEAEKQADEILARAREEAEAILASAKTRAREITEAVSRADAVDAASQSRAELKQQLRAIEEDGETRIAVMRAAAESRLNEAAQTLVDLLIGET